MAGVQKFHFAWDVPKCAPGCSDTWIGDGFCDRACNVSACNFDYPDCVNATSHYSYVGHSGNEPQHGSLCSTGCPDSWLGDRVCDTRCNTAECAWDMGDCGIDKVQRDLPGVALRPRAPKVPSNNGHKDNLLVVPFGTKGGYFDMHALNMSIIAVNHTESSILYAFMLRGHELLLSLIEREMRVKTPPFLVNFLFNRSFCRIYCHRRNSTIPTETISFSLLVERNLATNCTSRFPIKHIPRTRFVSACLSHRADHFPLVKAAYLAERNWSEYAMGSRAPRGVAVLIILTSCIPVRLLPPQYIC